LCQYQNDEKNSPTRYTSNGALLQFSYRPGERDDPSRETSTFPQTRREYGATSAAAFIREATHHCCVLPPVIDCYMAAS